MNMATATLVAVLAVAAAAAAAANTQKDEAAQLASAALLRFHGRQLLRGSVVLAPGGERSAVTDLHSAGRRLQGFTSNAGSAGSGIGGAGGGGAAIPNLGNLLANITDNLGAAIQGLNLTNITRLLASTPPLPEGVTQAFFNHSLPTALNGSNNGTVDALLQALRNVSAGLDPKVWAMIVGPNGVPDPSVLAYLESDPELQALLADLLAGQPGALEEFINLVEALIGNLHHPMGMGMAPAGAPKGGPDGRHGMPLALGGPEGGPKGLLAGGPAIGPMAGGGTGAGGAGHKGGPMGDVAGPAAGGPAEGGLLGAGPKGPAGAAAGAGPQGGPQGGAAGPAAGDQMPGGRLGGGPANATGAAGAAAAGGPAGSVANGPAPGATGPGGGGGNGPLLGGP